MDGADPGAREENAVTGRHPFHSICPYFAMFPERFVADQISRYTRRGDLVFDPFCGRGTTVFESLRQDRNAAGSDINPVAVCVSRAKATAPTLTTVLARISELRAAYGPVRQAETVPSQFFAYCYDRRTLAEILFLREELDWRRRRSDCFIAAMMLGLLHGDSHRSDFCLSNRMPRTISTKPGYSVRWWRERQLRPPRRDVFETLRKASAFRYRHQPARRTGVVREVDVRDAGGAFAALRGQVDLVVTSPPYFDTTDYAEDQWLRLWFLGGPAHPRLRAHRDDRHTNVEQYWRFLLDAWRGVAPLLNDQATIVIRIGGRKFAKQDLAQRLQTGLNDALGAHRVGSLHDGITTSIRARETSAFRPTPRRTNVEHDFVFRATARAAQRA